MAPFTLRLLVSLIVGLAAGVHVDPGALASDPREMANGFVVPAAADLVQVAFSFGLLLGAFAHGRGRVRLRDASAWLSVACLAWMLGAAAADRALHPTLRGALEEKLGEGVVAEGVLRQDASLSTTGVVLRLSVDRVWLTSGPPAGPVRLPRDVDSSVDDGVPVHGGVSVVVVGELAPRLRHEWTEGRRVRAPMQLRRPAVYLNAGVPDLERALALRGVSLVGTIKSGTLVEVVAPGAMWHEWGAGVRAHVRSALATHLSPGAAAVAIAILIGDRAALASDVERRLQEAGTYHVLAISGGNIAILAGAVIGALALAGWRGRGAALVAMLLLAAYAVVVEGGASVARATSMALLYLAIRLIDQRTAAVNALALVVIGILLVDPLAVVDVGLWLTAGATLGIVLAAERMRRWSWSAVRVVVALLMATVAAEVMLMPVSAFVFQRVTMAGIGLNFVAIPCMTVVQLGAMAIAALDGAGLERAASFMAWPTEWAVSGLVDSASFVDYAPWLTWRVPAPSVWTLLFYYVALVGWWLASRSTADTRLQRESARWSAATTVVLFAWIAADPPSLVRSLGDGRLHVTTIDVGQGDCVLVTFPNGRRLLVDTGGVTVGGDFDIGDRVVGPALRARGVRWLDYLAITHGDPDHIGGARAVVRDFAPTEVWQGVPVANHAPTEMLRAEANLIRAGWRTLQRGDRLAVGDVEVHVLHPPPPDWERPRVRNDDSIVLDLRFRGVSVVLTGDIGHEVEAALTTTLTTTADNAITEAPVSLRVLKVPHHGSATSSTEAFIRTLSPRIATIGVGRGNPYGHPAPQVLDRYREAGVEIFRTDEDGQIVVVTDGRGIEVSSFTGRRHSYGATKATKDTKGTKATKIPCCEVKPARGPDRTRGGISGRRRRGE